MHAFFKKIAGKERIKIIAEIKRKSPGHGTFPAHDSGELIAKYEAGGAAALSVVTEPTLFGGSLELLQEARRITMLPILRKDFITRTREIEETRKAGADAILLIAKMLTRTELAIFTAHALELGLDPVVEVHDESDLEKIAGLKNIIIGINNRNLSTFQTDSRHAQKFIERIHPSIPIIVESAMACHEDLIPYRGKANAALVGTAFLTSKDPQKLLSCFVSSASFS